MPTLFPACALAFSLLQGAPRVIDRTDERLPLIVRGEQVIDGTLVDDNPDRPAVVLLPGASLKVGEIRRAVTIRWVEAEDRGIGWIFGRELPKVDIGMSHHDFARAAVVGLGTVHFEADSVSANCGVLLTAEPSGDYGKGSTVDIGEISGFREGVLASGQQDLTVTIGRATAALWPNEPAGHTFYANESYLGKTFLRVKGVKLRIGSVRALARASRIRVDHYTAKFKGAWGVDYECLDDQNPCGALDAFDAAGQANVVWKHPGGDAQSPVALAFRLADRGGFGQASGRFELSGVFDHSLAPDPHVTSAALHMLDRPQRSFVDGVRLIGRAKADAYDGVETRGMTEEPPRK